MYDSFLQSRCMRWFVPGCLLIVFTTLYTLTASPDVQAGDSAEFQLVAAIGGVAHPTTYPLYTLLAQLTTWIIPFGTVAWRVTMLSVLCAAGAVALASVVLRRLGMSHPAALLGALVLGVTPGVWNAATIAEVYALLLLLSMGFAYALCRFATQPSQRHAHAVVLIGVLGCLHHGLFVLCIAPAGALVVVETLRRHGWQLALVPLIGVALLGLLPHTYPLIQFARFGPFSGADYALPATYYWGAPRTWSDVFDLLGGGVVRRGIFQVPDLSTTITMSMALVRRLVYEFGPIGIGLGAFGAICMLRTQPRQFVLTLVVALPAIAYVLALGPHIGDWPTFTLPLLLPWVWGVSLATDWIRARWGYVRVIIVALIVLTVIWGGMRYRVSAKQHLTLYREFATAVHQALPANAVVITHWEQGMTLAYLRYAEGLRTDVWVDVVEPGDDPWLARAQRRYATDAVYFVGHEASVQGIPVTRILDTPYADLYRLDSK